MWETIDWAVWIRKAFEIAVENWPKVIETLAKRHQILVLGASGAGKTQLCDSIFDPSAAPRATSDRTTEVLKRKGKAARKSFLLFDTPGEKKEHQPKRSAALRKAIQGRLDGIINVTCFGYHERNEADKQWAVPEKGPRVATAKFLAACRADELSMLDEWIPLVDRDACPWVLTVVTKADLWWPDRMNVMSYYESGKYADRLQHLRSIHSVLPYCATIRPFLGGRTSGEFGDEQKEALRRRLFEFFGHKVGDRG